MRISDWSSDVCSSDLRDPGLRQYHALCGSPRRIRADRVLPLLTAMTRRRDASPEPQWGCSMSTKMYGLIPRKQGMGLEEFHDYSHHPHGTLGRNTTPIRGTWKNHQPPNSHPSPRQQALA